ncbi:MAG: hypothetical protein Q9212_006812 [Teloschistes hypoglaucus]
MASLTLSVANARDQFHLGKRLSYDGELCTVRYKGNVVGTKGPWLGVEWDNPHRGKNDGSHNEIKYFDCWIRAPDIASFVRPSRPFDQPQGLLDAVRAKYGTSVKVIGKASEKPITIGGKQVDEVGFDRISQEQSAWSELAVVSLDRLRINCLFSKAPNSELSLNPFSITSLEGLKWKELCLANNLFERWVHIFEICYYARELKTLRLSGNRLERVSQEAKFPPGTFSRLDLASTLLPTLTSLNPLPCHFPALKALHTPYTPLAASHPHARLLTIARLPLLESLNYTIITRNERLDAELYCRGWIADLLLRAQTIEESNQIRREHPVWDYLCDTHGEPESIERKRREEGPALQPKYPPVSLGAKLIHFVFVSLQLPPPSSLPGMTTRPDTASELIQDLPRNIDIYRLKSLVGRHYSIPSMHVRLVLETNEWDPVPTTQLGGLDWASSNDDDSDDVLDISGGWDCADNNMMDRKPSTSVVKPDDPGRIAEKTRRKQEREERKKNRWVKREVVIPDSTRGIGDWVEGDEARVRVESTGELGAASEEALKFLEEEMF